MNLNISQKTQNDLTDVFQPEKAERPEVPKYLQNIEAEQKEEIRERKNRKKARPLNLSEVDKQFKARQQKLKQRDAEHQKKLKDRQLQQERSHKEFLSSLPKTKHAEEVRKEAAATVKADNKLRKELLNNLRKTSPRSVNSRSKSPAGHSNFNLSEEIMLGNNGRSPPGSPNGLYSEEYE
ncbi:hypothetical protein TRFO_22373 [Tritrichomonas foetus]|uniref:Uncharacterized protein n=1 Tax=Tritrichomonas foetus TaxID=1144522 RepID=A0A1J4KD86_9EUKA|nr:hypothetical protein TRFO_22373 [Tritrichomonas foetus]|eukprot:OHT08946.1 hypothetical protein TRFO_22373 [Tritrichomonas foetus]